ncbi:hypothetical protein NQZ68_005007 [Dissostichus eleginoides]|nr:hypothetical protein NQZ68_005007 [Dissostichus eleginoides]
MVGVDTGWASGGGSSRGYKQSPTPQGCTSCQCHASVCDRSTQRPGCSSRQHSSLTSEVARIRELKPFQLWFSCSVTSSASVVDALGSYQVWKHIIYPVTLYKDN